MSYDNVRILTETLQILNAGCYALNGKAVKLQLPKARMEASQVLLPDDVRRICDMEPAGPAAGRYRCSCVRADSFTAALDLSAGRAGRKPVLVLNFANPVSIGGGVYRGARAQDTRRPPRGRGSLQKKFAAALAGKQQCGGLLPVQPESAHLHGLRRHDFLSGS